MNKAYRVNTRSKRRLEVCSRSPLSLHSGFEEMCSLWTKPRSQCPPKTLFNHKFTSKLESCGQSATLDKHWPSILSQLSVSVDAGGQRRVGGSQSPWGGGGTMQSEFSQKRQYRPVLNHDNVLRSIFCTSRPLLMHLQRIYSVDIWNTGRSDGGYLLHKLLYVEACIYCFGLGILRKIPQGSYWESICENLLGNKPDSDSESIYFNNFHSALLMHASISEKPLLPYHACFVHCSSIVYHDVS